MLKQPFSWTDQAVIILRERLAVGDPASKIGAALGCSRNAIIGKAHRLNISMRNGKPANGAAVKSRTADLKDRRDRRAAGLPASSQEFDGFDSPVSPVWDDSKLIRFVDMEAHHCKFPVTTKDSPAGADMPGCGHDRTHGSYCSHHASIARGQGNRAEQHATDGMGGRRA